MTDKQLKEIKCGGFNFGVGLLIGGLFTFMVGLVDGYVRPLACR